VIDILGTLQSLQGGLPGLPGAPPAPAAPAPAAPAPVAPIPQGGEAMSGTLRRVAPTEREIILATVEGGQEKYLVLRVPADAAITRDGKPIALADLKEEEAATVRIANRDGKAAAAAIQVGQRVEGAVPLAPAPESRITQLRRVLQMADQVLEQFEKRPMR
jgi:hypothetical protein